MARIDIPNSELGNWLMYWKKDETGGIIPVYADYSTGKVLPDTEKTIKMLNDELQNQLLKYGLQNEMMVEEDKKFALLLKR